MCGLTYSGHPLACAAGIATLDVYKEEKLVERSKAMGKILGQIEEELKRTSMCRRCQIQRIILCDRISQRQRNKRTISGIQ